MDDSSKKAAYNIGGGIAGALLAAVAIFSLVSCQGSQTQPQKYSSQISYDQ